MGVIVFLDFHASPSSYALQSAMWAPILDEIDPRTVAFSLYHRDCFEFDLVSCFFTTASTIWDLTLYGLMITFLFNGQLLCHWPGRSFLGGSCHFLICSRLCHSTCPCSHYKEYHTSLQLGDSTSSGPSGATSKPDNSLEDNSWWISRYQCWRTAICYHATLLFAGKSLYAGENWIHWLILDARLTFAFHLTLLDSFNTVRFGYHVKQAIVDIWHSLSSLSWQAWSVDLPAMMLWCWQEQLFFPILHVYQIFNLLHSSWANLHQPT